MRTPFIAGNWKMNMNGTEAADFANRLKSTAEGIADIEIGVCPPAPVLSTVCSVLKGSNIGVGAQNMYWEDSGAFTGEISADMILDTGCVYVIIGHSERRQYFGETDGTVNKKVKKALEKGLTPIVCVGETLKQRKEGDAEQVVTTQVSQGLQEITEEDSKKIVIAYEPVWAIGTGETATPETAQEMHKTIRDIYAGLFSRESADGLRIQYGGSVKPGNVKDIMAQPDVDGALVGGASLEVDSFNAIIRFQE